MQNSSIEIVKQLLAEHGYRVTEARIQTFNLLVSAEPQSITEILARAKGLVDRVSIYRNIEIFEKIGIVHRVYIGWKYKLELSDDFMAHHHHLACLQCGKFVDIEDEKHIDEFINELARRYRFQPRRHQFEIDGYCSNCSAAIQEPK